MKTEQKDNEQEMQLEDILKKEKAFNWSDEEIGGSEMDKHESKEVETTTTSCRSANGVK